MSEDESNVTKPRQLGGTGLTLLGYRSVAETAPLAGTFLRQYRRYLAGFTILSRERSLSDDLICRS